MLPFQGGNDPLWLAPIDNLEAFEQARMGEQIQHHAVKRQGLKVAFA